MKKITKSLILTILSASIISCGTITKRHQEKVSITSSTKNATVIIDGKEVGQTPVFVDLSHCEDHNIIVEKDGYEEEYIHLKREVDAFVFNSNIFLFGAIGTSIDDSNCASAKFIDNSIYVTLYRSK